MGGITPRGALGLQNHCPKANRHLSHLRSLMGRKLLSPLKLVCPTIRTATPESENAESIARELDMSDELREAAAIRITSYQRRLANSYNRRVKPRVFQLGDLVLRFSKILQTPLRGNSNLTGKDLMS